MLMITNINDSLNFSETKTTLNVNALLLIQEDRGEGGIQHRDIHSSGRVSIFHPE